jgi:hypothetical protein
MRRGTPSRSDSNELGNNAATESAESAVAFFQRGRNAVHLQDL